MIVIFLLSSLKNVREDWNRKHNANERVNNTEMHDFSWELWRPPVFKGGLPIRLTSTKAFDNSKSNIQMQ